MPEGKDLSTLTLLLSCTYIAQTALVVAAMAQLLLLGGWFDKGPGLGAMLGWAGVLNPYVLFTSCVDCTCCMVVLKC